VRPREHGAEPRLQLGATGQGRKIRTSGALGWASVRECHLKRFALSFVHEEIRSTRGVRRPTLFEDLTVDVDDPGDLTEKLRHVATFLLDCVEGECGTRPREWWKEIRVVEWWGPLGTAPLERAVTVQEYEPRWRQILPSSARWWVGAVPTAVLNGNLVIVIQIPEAPAPGVARSRGEDETTVVIDPHPILPELVAEGVARAEAGKDR
jgi:hypothetical protein